jgi:hypothetical protein
MAGCVFYKGGETSIFEYDTAIQPDNQVPIPHEEIEAAKSKNSLDILGVLPGTFEQRLVDAVRNSVTLSQVQRRRLWGILRIRG